MIRRPQNVHIFFFRQNADAIYEYAVLQSADNHEYWQGASGGVRDEETIEQAALRVSAYEAGIPTDAQLYALTSMGFVPSYVFGKHAEEWGQDVVVVPLFYFAIKTNEIRISDQHCDYKWLKYDDAEKQIYFPAQKIGLWELNQRLLRGNLV